MKLAVLGAGAWGTAISISLAPRHAVTLWARDAAQAREIASSRINRRYLPEFEIPRNVTVTADLRAALDRSELVLIATTTAGLRAVLKQLAAAGDVLPLIWLCKGFETESARLPHQIAAEELPPRLARGTLSGPSFAHEVARGLPTALTLASGDAAFAQRIARELHHDRLRIYSSDDQIGIEIAGALKNVIAIASGISDGLGLGHNARAALITRASPKSRAWVCSWTGGWKLSWGSRASATSCLPAPAICRATGGSGGSWQKASGSNKSCASLGTLRKASTLHAPSAVSRANST